MFLNIILFNLFLTSSGRRQTCLNELDIILTKQNILTMKFQRLKPCDVKHQTAIFTLVEFYYLCFEK